MTVKRKLAAFGLAFSLSELASAYLSPLAVWLAVFFVWFAAALLFRSRKARSMFFLPLMIAVGLGLCCNRLHAALVVDPIRQLEGRTAQVTAVVCTDAETSYQEDRLRGTLNIVSIDGTSCDFLVSCASFPGTRPGEIFESTVEFQPLAEDSYRMNYYADGTYLSAEYQGGYRYLSDSRAPQYLLYGLRRELSRRLMTWLPAEEGGVEAAMLIGDTARLSDAQQDNFRAAGVSHLLAVSGLHVTLLCGLFVSAGDFLGRFSRLRITAQALLLLVYLALIGFPVSAVRAAFVYLVALGGYWFLQPPDTLTSMGFVAIVLGVSNPYISCDLGFQLSFSAVLGVQAAGGLFRWEQDRLASLGLDLSTRWWAALLRFVQTVQVSLLASMATLPVLLAHHMSTSGVSLLANLLVVWMLQPALLLGIAVLIFSAVPFLAFAMHGASFLLALWLRGMCSVIAWCASLPGAKLALPERYVLFVVAVLAVLGLIFRRAGKLPAFLPAALVCVAAAIFLGVQMGRGVVRIAAVGTAGNPCLVVTQNGRAAVLFRGGASNLNAVEEYLEEEGRLPQSILVDLRSRPRTMPFDADAVLAMETQEPGLQTVEILDCVTLELWHDSGGNLAVLDVNGYTVGIMSGRVNLPNTLFLDVYMAARSVPAGIAADSVVCTSHAMELPESTAETRILYSAETPVLTIRPGCSAIFEGVKEYAVQ